MKPIENLPNIETPTGNISSVYPCTGWLTFGPWIYLVPQYKPKNVLILGYAGGTVAGLIRLFYGDVPITAVDTDDCSDFNYYDVDLVQADAREYVKTADKFDTVIVDVFDHERSDRLCEFATQAKFSQDVRKICNYLIINGSVKDDLSVYDDLHLVRKLGFDDYRFYYYMVNRVSGLPLR